MFDLLMTAIINGNKEETLRLLSLFAEASFPELMKEVDSKGHNIIHYLARYNHPEALRFLRGKVPDVMFTAAVNTQTPVMLAAQGGACEAVAYFESEGIDFVPQQLGEDAHAPDDFIHLNLQLRLAVSAGNLSRLQSLLPLMLTAELIKSDNELRFIYLSRLLDLAIENKQMPILPAIVKCMSEKELRKKVAWLKENFCSLLSIGSTCTTIEYIERHYDDPVNVIHSLFPEDFWWLKRDLILVATQKSCLSILRGLLASFYTEKEVRKKMVSEVVEVACGLYEGTKSTLVDFFEPRNRLDVAALACASDFNQDPELMATVLKPYVFTNNTYVVDAFLKRVSSDTRMKVFEYQLPEQRGFTLSHIAVEKRALDVLVLLNQCGASYELKNADGMTVYQLASMQSDKAATLRLKKVAELEEKEQLIQSTDKSKLKQADVSAIARTHVGINQELRAFENPTLEEQVLFSMTCDDLRKEMHLQNIYFRMVSQITDGKVNSEAVALPVRMLTSAVSQLRRINGDNSEKNCISGLWRVLARLTQVDFGSDARCVYSSLSSELVLTGKRKSLFEVIVDITALEYGFMLEDYSAALTHLNRISAAAKSVEKEQAVFAGIDLPQVILTRLALIFCQIFKVSLPKQTKELLRKATRDKAALRLVDDKAGFSLQTPVAFLSLVNPVALGNADIREISNLLCAFKDDVKNYADIQLSDELCQSPLYRTMASRTLADIAYVYQWWCVVERKMCSDAWDYQLSDDINKLTNVSLFLQIKSTTLKLLSTTAIKLDKLLKKATPSPIIAKLKEEYEKVDDKAKELASIINPREEKKEEELTEPPINPIIIWATKQRDTARVMLLLKVMDVRLLLTPYKEDACPADYLAELFVRTGQHALLKFLMQKLVDSGKTFILDKLMRIAIEANQRSVVEFLDRSLIATPFHAQAYESKWPEEASPSRALCMDSAGMPPLAYAVSGGDVESVNRLLAITPPEAVSHLTLLLRCLKARQFHLLPSLVKLVGDDDITRFIFHLFVVSNEFENRLDLLKPIIDIVGIKKFAFMAMRHGYTNLMLAALSSYQNKDERVKVACYLLIECALEYGEMKQCESHVNANKKQQEINGVFGKIIRDQKAALLASQYANQNIKRGYTIARIARLMAKDFDGCSKELYTVLGLFCRHSHDGGVRELLSNLPLSVASAAINYQPQEESLPPERPLLYSAIIYSNTSFLHAYVQFGGNLKAKCHPASEQTLEQLIAKQQKMGMRTFSQDLVVAEQHLQAFTSLLNRLMQGEKLSQDEIDRVVADIKEAKVAIMPLRSCIDELWDTVTWCTKHRAQKTDFDSALRLAREIMHAADGVEQCHYIKYAALAFALGNYNQAAKYVEALELAVYSLPGTTQNGVAQLITARLVITLLDSLRVTLPPQISKFYLEEWETLHDRQLIGEGFMPFISEAKRIVNVKSLENLLQQMVEFKISEMKKSDSRKTKEDASSEEQSRKKIKNNVTAILEIHAINSQLLAFLMTIEMELLQPNADGSSRSSKKLLELFYQSANHINLYLMKSWEALALAYEEVKDKDDKNEIKPPQSFVDFRAKVDAKMREFSLTLAEVKKEVRKVEVKKEAAPKKPKAQMTDAVKKKRLNIAGWGVRMTPEQLLAILPPLTHIEEPPPAAVGKPQSSKSKGAQPKKQAKQPSSSKVVLVESKKAIKRKAISRVIADVTDFPDLPIKKTEELAAPETALTPVVATAVENPVVSAPVSQAPSLLPEDTSVPPSPPFHAIPEDILEILRFFGARGPNEFTAYLTGGTVRDCLMGRPLKNDYDITVDCDPKILEEILQRKFGVGNVVRKGQDDKAHSWSVKYNGLDMDFSSEWTAKRDFTCNAIYWHPDILDNDGSYPDFPGSLCFDPHGGMKDIENKTLRPIDTSEQSFVVNTKLIFRKIRFEEDLHFISADIAENNIRTSIVEIQQIPYRQDQSWLSTTYEKMREAFKGDITKLHSMLTNYGLFKGIKARLKLEEPSDISRAELK